MGIVVRAARRSIRFLATRGGSRFVLGIATLCLTTGMLTLCRAGVVPWHDGLASTRCILVEIDGLHPVAVRTAPRVARHAARRVRPEQVAARPAAVPSPPPVVAAVELPAPPDASAPPDRPAPAARAVPARPHPHRASRPKRRAVARAKHQQAKRRAATVAAARPRIARPRHVAARPAHAASPPRTASIANPSRSYRETRGLPSAVATAPENPRASTAAIAAGAAPPAPTFPTAPTLNPAMATVTVVGRIEGPVESGTMADVTDTVYLVDLTTWKAIRGKVDRNGAFAFSDLTPGGLYCIVAWHQTRQVNGISMAGGNPQTQVAGARLSWHESLQTSQPGLYSLELTSTTADTRYYADLLPPVDPTRQAPYRSWRQAILRPLIGQGS